MYATADDLVTRYDRALLADLAGDDAAPTDPVSSARVLRALEGASGEVNAAARLGGRYSAEELSALTGDDRAFLIDVVCQLAILRLIGTRIQSVGEAAYRTLRENSDRLLDDLRSGRVVFGTDSADRSQTPRVDGPTALDYERLNLITQRTRRYYPSPGSRLPLGR